jgi:AAA15 family ATPase/GTPase
LVPSISSKRFNNFTNELLKTLDTGVNGLGIDIIDFDMFFAKYDDSIKKDVLQKLNNEKTLLFRSDIGTVFVVKKDEKISVLKVISLHNSPLNKDIIFDISDESDGTQRLLDLIPAFDRIIQYDQTFIVDEIDRSLHPALLKSLVRKIMEDNTTKGQLVFTTHESNLLDMDIFRQDEIWFVEKDRKTCGTQLYSLSEYKPRYDLDIRKGYLNGRFGAIPFLANLEDLNWHTQNA